MEKNITRRQLLGGSLAAVAGLAAGSKFTTSQAHAGILNKKAKRSIRFAHMTDIHLEPKRNAPQGLTAALRHVHTQKDKPDMIITGGDNVMDMLGCDANWADTQINLLKEIFVKECKLPVKYCIGNHDTWGWDKNSNTNRDDELWGKERFVKAMGLENRYYSFDAGNWRIFILDSTHIDERDAYTAKFDDEQFNWLADQLKKSQNKHVCLINHIPILSAAVILDGDNVKQGRYTLPDEWMHLDSRKLVDLFWENKQVKLCVSGHLHLQERLDYNDVTYICDGAVCGAWWGGAFQQCQEGYGLFDLYEDGSFGYQYIDYNWEVEKA
ncbi:MAG: 3',5'-cyclic adenosine monophosphate phosphodiesterase CpdA [Planctomycetes bacterium ADurb.Bin401]|nr:MAG: 3',5'-cyclic adenosine monophosphate phosphodiesterase CpdA [Planctomycetes bacterium ADurb.Bin401]